MLGRDAPGSPEGPGAAKRRKTGGGDSDSSDDAPLATRALPAEPPAAAAASSGQGGEAAPASPSSSGSSSASDSDSEAGEAGATGKAAKPRQLLQEVAEPAGEDAESSDSDSSSSESEAEGGAEGRPEAGSAAEGGGSLPELPPPEVEDEETRRLRELALLHGAQLRRDELARLLISLPDDEAETALLRSFVRIAGSTSPCVLAEVSGLERAQPYEVPLKGDRGVDMRMLNVMLRCKRGSSTRLIKVTAVSNQDATDSEFEQWKKLSLRTGVDAGYFFEQMQEKGQAIREAKNFVFSEGQASKKLVGRANLEFDAQKESRMRFLVQCAISQMDISGIRDRESEELESRYREALKNLQEQEEKSAKVQEEWFEKRPNLFSLKMINKKNADRQIRDDRHALAYALQTEEGGAAQLNPFQRRACRPVVAWDTKLTAVEGLTSTSHAPPPQEVPTATTAPPVAAVAPPPGPAPSVAASLEVPSVPTERTDQSESATTEPTCEPELSRVDRMMRAHRRADLLAKLGPLVMPQAA